MKRETKLDIIELSRAYLGVLLFSWWGFWSNANYGTPFVEWYTFITSFFGFL